MRSLEEEAHRLRQRLEELELAAVSSNQLGIVTDLDALRARAEERLAVVVAELESLRLGLLRLQGGTATIEMLTWELGEGLRKRRDLE